MELAEILFVVRQARVALFAALCAGGWSRPCATSASGPAVWHRPAKPSSPQRTVGTTHVADVRPKVLSTFHDKLGVNARWRQRPHPGVDIEAPIGATVIAADDGCVVRSYSSDDSGGFVAVFHPDTLRYTVYVHLASMHVWEDEWVNRGQKVGTVGLFRNSGGVPHLHLEMWEGKFGFWDDNAVDPKVDEAVCNTKTGPATTKLTLPIKCDPTRPEAPPARTSGCLRVINRLLSAPDPDERPRRYRHIPSAENMVEIVPRRYWWSDDLPPMPPEGTILVHW